jgi:phage baseplate assembly protein W
VYNVELDQWVDTPEAAARKAKVAAAKKDILLRWEKRSSIIKGSVLDKVISDC